LKKLMLLAALLAMMLVTAVPAIAQVIQPPEQSVESGDSSQTMTVTGGGITPMRARAYRVSPTLVTP
jgi:hypothetical protein